MGTMSSIQVYQKDKKLRPKDIHVVSQAQPKTRRGQGQKVHIPHVLSQKDCRQQGLLVSLSAALKKDSRRKNKLPEVMIHRFAALQQGGVTGSHNRLLPSFHQKQSGKQLNVQVSKEDVFLVRKAVRSEAVLCLFF